jgi:alpha-tubulin suppressor-like RCC1 family protein
MRATGFRLWLIAFLTVGIASWWQLPTVAQAPAQEAGVVYGAGDSFFGELGVVSINVSPPLRPFPSPASPFQDVIDAALGADHSLVLRADGSVWGTGSNQFGQLGQPSQGDSGPQPRRVMNLPTIVKVAAGANHSLVLDNTGAVWAFGSDSSGQLGIGVGNNTASFVPVMIPTLSSVVDIAAGTDFSVAVDSAGKVWAWGNNQFFQLGDPGPTRTTPILVPKGPAFFVTNVAAGGRTAMALSNFGSVMAWGANGNSQIGPGTGSLITGAPIANNVHSMAVGDSHVLLLKTDGSVVARGLGTSGQLGNGNITSSSVFVTVPGLTNVVDVGAGAAHSAAIRDDGSIWTWGSNTRNQLGTNTSAQITSPKKLFGFPSTGRSVVAAGHSSFFLNQPGQIGVTVTAPINMSCNYPFDTQVSLTGYDALSTTPNEIMLVLDESGSIGAANFNLLLDSARNFVNAQNIGPQANRVGIVLFSNQARKIISLSSTKATLLSAIDDIVYGNGSATCIGCGIALADQTLDAQARPTANRMMVVVTDGVTTASADPHFEEIVTDAQQSSTLFAIGVGSQVSASQINFIASDIPNVTTAILSPDFTSLSTIIANLSTDVVPAFTNVTVTLDLGSAIVQDGAATATAGNVTPGAGLITWYLPDLGSTTVTLTVPQRGLGQNGTLPLFDSIRYDAGNGPFPVAVPTIDIVGCPVSIELNPPSATHTVGQNHSATVAARDEFGQVASVPMLVSIIGGPNAGRSFNVTPNGVPATFGYSSSLPGVDTLRALAIGYPSIPPAIATVEWRLPNQAPTANAGPDKVVELSGATTATFTLFGSGTDDGKIQPLSYQWYEGASPVGNATPMLTLTRGLGVYDFTLTDFDGELSGNDSARVTVVDPTPPLVTPAISGPSGSNGWFTGDVTLSWSAVDLESAITSPPCPTLVLDDDGANQSVGCFAKSAGGPTNGSASVSIDSVPPEVTVPASFVAPATGALTPVTYSGESATDLTSGVASFGCAPASGSDFPLGPTTVTCTATDGAGHTTVKSFTVTVKDATPPAIAVSIAGTEGDNDWYRSDVTVTFTITDPETTATSCDPVTFTTNGNHTYSCSSTSDGGTTVVSGELKIDTTPPTITGAVNRTIEATGPLTPVSHPGVSAADLTSGLASLACDPAAGAPLPLGAIPATCTAMDDAGNKFVATFSLTLVDTTPPVLTLPASVSENGTDPAGAPANWTATASDAVSGAEAVTCTPPSGSTFGYGATTVACSATDDSGNTATGTILVTVNDLTPPVIAATVNGTAGDNGWYVSDVVVSWSVTDPQTAISSSLGCGPTTVSTDGAAITLTCTAESAGGSSSKTVTLSRDATGPALNTSPNLSVVATSLTGATVNYAPATAMDPLSGVASVSCTPPSGFFPIGTTPVACTAKDLAGNSSARSFTVTVGDNIPPVINTTTASVASLSPPNHQMVPLTIAVTATDNLAAPVCSITGVTSNEPQNGLGDGDTPNDWLITGPLTLQLRAERAGNGNGRIYTIAVRCADAAGNAATSSTTVAVPKGKK